MTPLALAAGPVVPEVWRGAWQEVLGAQGSEDLHEDLPVGVFFGIFFGVVF